jgi:hypothetical protein
VAGNVSPRNDDVRHGTNPVVIHFHKEASFVSTDPTKAYRDQLTFEQQARFDALYARRAKKEGTARALSMPLLGTFGAEQFYLGHSVRGVVSVIFSWTLIPTVVALFDLANGDLKRQVALANTRVAREVYQNVLRNTIGADAVPPAAAPVVNVPPVAVAPPPPTSVPPVDVTATAAAAAAAATAAAVAATEAPAAEVAPVATETVVAAEVPAEAAPAAVIAADSIADAAPAAPAVEEAAAEEDLSANTTATFTQTTTSATWQAGMDAPATTSDTQTATVGETEVIAEAAAAEAIAPAAAVAAAPDEGVLGAVPPDESPVVVMLDAAPATEAVTTADAEVIDEAPAVAVVETPAADAGAADGVLVFMDDATPAAPATEPTPVVVAEDAQQTQDTVLHQTVTESNAESDQHYVDGKLVSASRNETRLTGDINTLVTDHQEDALLAEVEARAGTPTGWVDVSPLHPGSGTAPAAAQEVPADTGGTGAGGTNSPGGGLGNGGTDVPGGGLGGGDGTDGEAPPHPGGIHDGPIPF